MAGTLSSQSMMISLSLLHFPSCEHFVPCGQQCFSSEQQTACNYMAGIFQHVIANEIALDFNFNSNKQIQRIVVPPLGNKFDLKVAQRSPSRSRHGTIGKVLSQRTNMPNIKALPVIVQKLWQTVKVFVTDGRTDRPTDRQTNEI